MNICHRVVRGCVLAGALLANVVAQSETESTQAEVARTQRSLQQNRTEVDRLLDLRMRHDLGLATDPGDKTFRSPAPVSTDAMERMHQELRDEDAATATMLERFNKLKTAAEQLKAEVDERTRREAEEQPFVTVPSAGTAPSRTSTSPPAPAGASTTENIASPPAPGGETAGAAGALDPVAVNATLDPLRAQIHGSTDHQRVAQSLFKAGQALMDRAVTARNQGQDAIGKELDDRGKEQLRRALDELSSLLQGKQPPYDALFYQGRSLELLFRHAERHENLSPAAQPRDYQRREQEVREPFLRIAARDVRKSGARGETEVLGAWGMAAQSAMEHFRWMNLHASYDATKTIRALTWPGADDR